MPEVIADNASVMARNAAAMTLFDRTEISTGFLIIDSKVKLKDSTYSSPLASSVPIDNTQNDNTSFVPNLYIVHPVNQQLSLGLGLYSNFGTRNEFDSDWGKGTGTLLVNGQNVVQAVPGADAFGGKTKVTTTNIALSAAYRLNEQWSIGGGLDIIYGEGDLQRASTMNVVQVPSTPTGTTNTQKLMNIDANAWTLGFNLGTVFELDENNRFGFSYRYSPEKEVSGTVEFGGDSDIGDLKIPLPDMAEFSGYHRIENSPFAVHYSVQWIDWSTFERLETTNGTLVKDYQWQDNFHYALGATYYINQNWEARIGYLYDEGVEDQLTSVSVPDSDRQWFSAGATYHINADQAIDLGFTYLVGKDQKVSEVIGSAPAQIQLDTTTSATAILFGMQYTHRF